MLDILKGTKYPEAIEKTLKMIFEDFKKKDPIFDNFEMFVETMNGFMPIRDLDRDLQIGVNNGYSIEKQLVIFEEFASKIWR